MQKGDANSQRNLLDDETSIDGGWTAETQKPPKVMDQFVIGNDSGEDHGSQLDQP